eukprot:1020569-Alexandrium_andersonii.AAC.1
MRAGVRVSRGGGGGVNAAAPCGIAGRAPARNGLSAAPAAARPRRYPLLGGPLPTLGGAGAGGWASASRRGLEDR